YVDRAGFRLGRWVANHRYRRAALTPGQIARLEAVPGWSWDPFEARWQASYLELAQYAAPVGHTSVPASYATTGRGESTARPSLGRWVAQQRSDYAHGKLSARRQQLLEALPGWTWSGHQARARRAAVRLPR